MCILLVGYAYYEKRNKKYSFLYLWLSILLFSLVFGMRYGVGIDYLSYLDYYINPYAYYGKSIGMEVGFDFVSKLLYNQGLHFVFFFGLIAFAQIGFFLFGLKKIPIVLPFVFFCLMTSGILLGGFMNVMRQSISFTMFVYSIQFIVNKNFVKYLFCILCASLIHFSAIILIPFYLLAYINVDFTKKINIQIILYILSIIVSKIGVFDYIIEFLSKNLFLNQYERTLSIMADTQTTNLVFNIDFILRNIVIVIIIIYSDKLKIFFQDKSFVLIYQLFFIGVLLNQIFSGSMSLNRINMYFYNYFPVVSGFAICFFYLSRKSSLKYRNLYLFISAIFILLFMKDMYAASLSKSTSKYVFYFEQERYIEKQIELQNVINARTQN